MSGVEETARQFLGAAPAGWVTRRFKHIATIREGQVDPEDAGYRLLPLLAPNHIETGTGRILLLESAEAQGAESGKYLVDAGDVVYSKIRPALRKVAVAPTRGLCSADMYAIKPRAMLAARFLFWSMLSDGFYRYSLLESDRVAMPKINREALGECAFMVPPMPVQLGIANFLDRKTAAIDALIAKKERLVALLHEERQALITHAVTKGITAFAQLKASGVEWMGQIPAHWSVPRMRQVARLESGHTPSRQHPEYWRASECVVPWISLADVWQLRDGRREYIDDTAERVSHIGIANSAARILPRGTVVLSRTASVGFSGIMAKPMATTQDFVNWVCGPLITPEFLLYVFRAMTPEFARLTMGSVHNTIYMPAVATFTTPLPPIDEQNVIVESIRSRTRRVDTATEKLIVQVEELGEYRQALITAAVTGKIDVTSCERADVPIPEVA